MGLYQCLNWCFRRPTLTHFSGICGLFTHLDRSDASLQSLVPYRPDVKFFGVRSRNVPVPMIPQMSGYVWSAQYVNRPTTYDSVRKQVPARNEIKRVVDCHLSLVVVSYRNTVKDGTPFLLPRDTNLPDDGSGWPKSGGVRSPFW
jgi:hypothetical protein